MSDPKAPIIKIADVATTLRAMKDKIIEEWIKRLKSEVPPARHTEKTFLINSLPIFLENLALSLEKHRNRIADAEKTAADHADQRISLKNFSLPDVLTEYKILRQVIFDCLEAKIEIPLRDRNVILDFIQTGTIEVAAEFSRLSQLELETRHNQVVESRSQFVASLAHDLKTPLSSARLMAQFVFRQTEEGKLQDALAMTLRNIDRVDRMVENFLDVNLIIANHPLVLRFEKFDLLRILKDVQAEMSIIYGPRFVLELPKEKLVARWAVAQLTRCLENLCHNAVKYGEEKKPVTITASLKNDHVRIDIHNSGEPIPEEQLQRLFEPYHRADSAQKSGKKGWGLGLTLVKGVAEAHGGSVGVRSNKDGTIFSLILPLDHQYEGRRNE